MICMERRIQELKDEIVRLRKFATMADAKIRADYLKLADDMQRHAEYLEKQYAALTKRS